MLGHASGSAAAPPLPPAHPLPLHMRLMRRGEQAVTLFSLLLQLALYSRSAFTLTARQHLHQLALLLLRGVCLAAATLLPPKAWLRWRVPLIAGLRLAIALVPSQRSAGEGDAVLLERPATPGALGALRDWLRLLTGTRILPMGVIGAVLQQPPLAVLGQQALLMYITSDAAYCDSQLASDPLSRTRLAGLWNTLDDWVLQVAPTVDRRRLSLDSVPAGMRDAVRCCAVIVFHQCIVGVMLPVLVAGYTAPFAGQQPPAGQQQPQPSGASRAKRMVVAACGSLARFDAALQSCCGCTAIAALQLSLACYLLAGNFWALAKAAALRTMDGGRLAAAAGMDGGS